MRGLAHERAMAAAHGGEALVPIAGLAFLCAIALVFALALAARARRPSSRKPAKKTFEHGRRLARMRRILSAADAREALRKAPIGETLFAEIDETAAEIVVRRKRGQPCEQAAGFLAGLFESAWGDELLVTHNSCAGAKGECRYSLRREPIGSARPAGEASTPRSGGARRRSPRAHADAR